MFSGPQEEIHGAKKLFPEFCNKGSQFWKDLHECKMWLVKMIEKEVGDGLTTSLWNDVWVDRCPLMIMFPNLYAVYTQQNATVRDIY